MTVDEDKGTLLGEVTGIQGAHGTAGRTTRARGYILAALRLTAETLSFPELRVRFANQESRVAGAWSGTSVESQGTTVVYRT